MTETRQEQKKQKKKVAIFGAGVAGLTAAHELIERGFEVTVYDEAICEEIHVHMLDRGIGGMARSQWAADLYPETGPMRVLESSATVIVNDTIVFGDTTLTIDGHKRRSPRAGEHARALQILEQARWLLNNQPSKLYLVIPIDAAPASTDGDATAAPPPDPRVTWIREQLGPEYFGRLKVIETESRELTVAGNASRMGDWAFFQLPEVRMFPAEHGFRFFPAFYRHLFHTMGRIPLLFPRPHERSARSVRDNLIPSDGLGFARGGDAASFMIPRQEIRSLDTALHYLGLVLRELEYSLSDIKRFSLKLLKYATSCSERRQAEYEDCSWGDFIEQRRYSEVSRRHIEFGPQMSAALKGSESDARTQGNISLQLLVDQSKPGANSDFTLNAPTSTAWFNHWHDYLKRQRVRFVRAKLSDFAYQDGQIKPRIDRTKGTATLDGGAPAPTTVDADFYVLALSLPGMVAAAGQFIRAAEEHVAPEDLEDFHRVRRFAGGSEASLQAQLAAPKPNGPLQHLSGIQFYLDEQVNFWRGHTQYLDSAWGLTSIAQPQFWASPRQALDGYNTVLSVDIGIWDSAKGPQAWATDRDALAREAWEQIRQHHDDDYRRRFGDEKELPIPTAYAFDQNMTAEAESRTDSSPFLVNRVGAFGGRPGALPPSTTPTRGDERRPSKQISHYRLHAGKFVLAGTFMKTFTRLTSMESANESARHAVNAILGSMKQTHDHCRIWDPEENELEGLAWFKELDRRRFFDRKPNLVDTLTVEDCLGSDIGLFL